MTLQIVYWMVTAACTLYAYHSGGRSERAGAVIILLGSIATSLVTPALPDRYRAAEIGILAVDLPVLFALVHLALRSRRYWPLWVAAFQLVAVTTHLAMLVVPNVVPEVYALLQGFWAYPMLLSIAIATRQRQARAAVRASSPIF